VLEFGDDFADGAFAVAALDDFEAGAVEAKGAFGHQQDLLVVVLAEADAGGETWMRIEIDAHFLSSYSRFYIVCVSTQQFAAILILRDVNP
jgi:hypothetical protein